ncbi:uncharacterized protein HD556DRAFT_1431842 [Suillus plorans]|uniref:Histone deacetylase domain-containing protein n=1 Tax=Suillus plorans TaxID=116603 RepID=A0A9P7AS88_9AGAM|nr:uncharacterized protein HD556DRAFT_1431842 [Suillus plorans]KAG1795211.1 hypothetical protein HD556DRAFT_1431842 [Suillus plorans]
MADDDIVIITRAYIFSEDLVKVSTRIYESIVNCSLFVYSLVHAYGLLATCTGQESQRFLVVRPRPAGQKEFLGYHTQVSECGLEDDCPMFHGIKDYITLVAGVTLTGAAATRNDISDIAICWDGGSVIICRHHAKKAWASAFCYIADCVLAILFLKRTIPKPHAASQAFHKPGSTAAAQVLTLSIHHAAPGFFPLPLKARAPNKTFLRIWPIIEHVKDIFRPDFIIVQCGLDGLAGSLGWCMHRIIREWQGKKCYLAEALGGYDTPNAAQAWTYLTSVAVCLNLRFWFVIY